MDRPDPYNPLARRNLARSVEYALLTAPVVPLGALTPFLGAGIYAIYYSGPFPPYRPIAAPGCPVPIYVGMAQVAGARKGGTDGVYEGTSLHKRLSEHVESIRRANNLEIEDFRCRYLVVDDIWIPLGESLMIANFKPLWNVVVDGFGIHDPGAGRYGSLRSEWDELHPGRPWYSKMAPRTNPDAILAKIAHHFATVPPPPMDPVPEN